MQSARTTAWLLPCTGLAVFAATFGGGCASGTWLERSITAELPVDAPSRGYPTAIASPGSVNAATPSTAQPATAYSISDDSPADESLAAVAPSAAVTASNQSPAMRERQTAHLPVLAVVPPQLAARPPAPQAAPAASAPPPAATLPPQAAASAPEGAWSAPTSPMLAQDPSFASLFQLTASPSLPTRVSNLQPPATPAGVIQVSAATTDAAESQASVTRLDSANAPPALDKVQSEWITALEAEIRRRRDASSTDEELPRLEQQLRLAYVAAGRLEEAATEIESLDAAQREAYKNLMFGLGIWLSPDEARRAPLRTAKVLHSLRDATTDLAGSSKLELRNLVFCERVDYFGWYTEFPRKEFQPKQQVLLYVEVQNFAAEHKGPGGYETELQGSYEILDGSGQIIASRQLPLDKEICRNYRRDYFLAYRIYMPDAIEPGHYRLELTVEDLKARGKYQGRKLGEGMIEFTVR